VIKLKNRGYTIPELIIVAVVVGIFSITIINKASYAFVDTNEISEETQNLILVKSATAYANSIKDELKEENTKYVSAEDLVEAGYLSDDDYDNNKIKIEYNEETDSIKVEVIE
jgi:prepilin-type N-terminal cleavage/methylation domain-containing protein